MARASRISTYLVLSIAIIALVILISSSQGIYFNSMAETAGPEISYQIDGTNWTSSKDITITIDSAYIISEVTINGDDVIDYISETDYLKVFEYTADSSEDIVISATDINDETNVVTIQANELYIDTVEPEFNIGFTGITGSWTSQNIVLTFTQVNTINSGYTYYHSKNAGEFTAIVGNSVTYSASSMNGEYTYKAVSGSGITYNFPLSYDVMIDKTAPLIPSANLLSSYYTNLTVNFNLSLVSDELSPEIVYYTTDGSRPNTSDDSLDIGATLIIFPANGIYAVRLLAIDGVGNEGVVRTYLIKVDATDYQIDFDVNPLGGGLVSGDDTYKRNDIVELIATANEGYIFRDITLGGVVVSYDNTYYYEVDGSGDKTFIANFIKVLTITAEELTFDYDGDPKPIVIHDDSGEILTAYTQILYNGSSTAPTNAGVYDVVVIIDHPDYYGYQEFTLTINKAVAVIDVNTDSLTQTYGNVSQIDVTITPPPADAILTVLYDGSTSLPVDVGVYNITIIVSSDNYSLIDDTYELEIIKATVSIILANKTVTYNSNPVTVNPASTIPGSLTLDYEYYSGEDLLDNPPINVGVYTVKAVFDGNDNYEADESNIATLTINQKQLTITNTVVIKSKIYDGSESVIITNNGALNGVCNGDDILVNANANYNSEYVLIADSITVVYTISGVDSDNYIKPVDLILTDGVDGVIEITKRQLTIASATLTDTKIYDGNTDAEVTAGALTNKVNGDDVTVSAVAYYDIKDITASIITIDYSIIGDDISNYFTPVSEEVAGIINPKQLTVTDTDITLIKLYDCSSTATINDKGILGGIIGLEDVDFTAIATYNSKNVTLANTVTAIYTLTGDDKDNYLVPLDYITIDGEEGAVVRIDALQLTATYSVTNMKIYDGNTSAVSAFISFDNAYLTDNVSATTDADYNSKNVLNATTITVVFTLSGSDKDNYIKPININEDGTITTLKLLMNNPTLGDFKVYDKSDDATAIITNNGATNIVSGDVVNITHAAAYNSEKVLLADTITVSYTIDGADQANYSVPDDYYFYDSEILPLQLTIDGSLDMVKSREYNSTTEVTVNDKGALTNVILGDTVDFNITALFNTKSVTATSIGVSYELTGADCDNYIKPVDQSITSGVSITTFALNISNPTIPASKVYDGALTASVTVGALTNLFVGDTVSVGATGTYNFKDVATGTTVNVVYNLTGADAINYTLSGYSVGATITKRKLTISNPTFTPKTYDGLTAATSTVIIGNLTNKVGSDAVNISYTAVYDDYRVASVTKVTVTYTIAGGAQSNNYSAPDTYDIINATIIKKQLTATGTLTQLTKAYDGTATANVNTIGTLNGIVNPDIVTLSATAVYNSGRVDQANSITTTYSIDGADKSNYFAPVPKVDNSGVIISKLTLTVTDPTLSLTKVYDGTNSVLATVGTLTNVISGDNVSAIISTATFNTSNVSANSITVVYSLTGVDMSNYNKPANKVYNTGVSISKLDVTINYSNLSYVYDGNPKAASAIIDNYDSVKHIGFTLTILYQFEGNYVTTLINAGTYQVSIDMSLNTNYNCTSIIDLIINPAVSYMSIDDKFTSYDGNTPELDAEIRNEENGLIEDIEIIYTYFKYADSEELILHWEFINWNINTIDDFTWEEIVGSPVNAGVYKVVGNIATGSNYSSASSTALLKISKALAEVMFISESLTNPYGSVTGVEITTYPLLDPINFLALYNDSETLPENAGSYAINVSLIHENYYGSKSGTFIVAQRQAANDIVIEKVNITINGDMSGYSLDYSGATFTTAAFSAHVAVEGLEELPVIITFKYSDIVIEQIHDAGSYSVVATINSQNIVGEKTVQFVINKVAGIVTYTPQSLSFNGTGIAATGAVTTPLGLGVNYTYSYDEGSTFIAIAPINVGVYPVKIEIYSPNYTGEIESSITIIKANTQIVINDISRTYSGSFVDLDGVATFTGDIVDNYDVEFKFTYNSIELDNYPINAGIYTMQVSFVDRNNFLNADSQIKVLEVRKATPSIVLEDMEFPYDGLSKTIPATIIPAIDTELIYTYYRAVNNGGIYVRGDLIGEAPIEVGIYIISVSIEDGGDNFTGAVSNDTILIINQGIATINSVPATLTQSYDGEIKSIEIITDPLGINVDLVYRLNGSIVDPINPGTYIVTATINDETYQGFATFTLIVTKCDISDLITFTGNTTVEYNGSPKSLTSSIPGYTVNLITQYSPANPQNAGTYNVTVTINNALYSGSKTQQLIITKKLITVTAIDTTRSYGADSYIPLNYTGFIGNDNIQSLTTPATVRIINEERNIDTTGFNSSITVGTYDIMPGNATAVNYKFEYFGAILSVNKAPLTVNAVAISVEQGITANPNITYTGFKYNDNALSVFGSNRPVIKYYDTETTLSSVLPIIPGVYTIIPEGGIAVNYVLDYQSASLIVLKNDINSSDDTLFLSGAFHPESIVSITEVDRSTSNYKAIKSAVSGVSKTLLFISASNMSIEINDSAVFLDDPVSYKILIPEKLRGKEIKLLFMNADGKVTVQEFTVEGNYAVGTIEDSTGTFIFAKPLNIWLIIIILGSVVAVLLLFFGSKYIKKVKAESPKALSGIIAPITVAPLEALEDEDAAFDTYIEKMVEDNNAGKLEIERQEKQKEEDDIILDIDEKDYTEDEIKKLKEKARKAKHLSVEERITQEVERQLVESFSETKKDVMLKEFTPSANDSGDDLPEDVEITDEYIINNQLYPSSNQISMEEAQALYSGRGIRRYNGRVALEVCFESALNLTDDKNKHIYSEIKNTFYSYLGVESKIFKSGEAFKGGNVHSIIRMRNDSPILYISISKEYLTDDIIYTDRSADTKYKDMPIEIVVNSGKQLQGVRKVINTVMIMAGLNRNPDYKYVNYINKYPMIENAVLDEG